MDDDGLPELGCRTRLLEHRGELDGEALERRVDDDRSRDDRAKPRARVEHHGIGLDVETPHARGPVLRGRHHAATVARERRSGDPPGVPHQ